MELRVEELEELRAQDNIEILELEKLIESSQQKSKDLEKQVELSGKIVREKTEKLEELEQKFD